MDETRIIAGIPVPIDQAQPGGIAVGARPGLPETFIALDMLDESVNMLDRTIDALQADLEMLIAKLAPVTQPATSETRASDASAPAPAFVTTIAGRVGNYSTTVVNEADRIEWLRRLVGDVTGRVEL